MCTQHCGHWCPGAKAPGHQYPHCWWIFLALDHISIKILHEQHQKSNHILKKKMNQSFNSSPPTAAYMRWWTGSALFQIMACRLGGAKPLSKPTLKYCQSKPKEHISMTVYLKLRYFQSRKCVGTCRLRNGGHFVHEGGGGGGGGLRFNCAHDADSTA